MPSERNTMSLKMGLCIARGPNFFAARTPSQFATDCGGFQRKSPTGGAAKGTPLNARTFVAPLYVPSTTPLAVTAKLSANFGAGAAASGKTTKVKKPAPTIREIFITRVQTPDL